MSRGICVSAVCGIHWCVLYIHTLYFFLNSLKQLVLNILKATTTEWEHRLAYGLGRKHYSFILSHGYLLVWAPSHVIISLSHLCQNSFPFQIRIQAGGSEWAQLILSYLLCFATSFTSPTNNKKYIWKILTEKNYKAFESNNNKNWQKTLKAPS